jgi:hypothetical protein
MLMDVLHGARILAAVRPALPDAAISVEPA